MVLAKQSEVDAGLWIQERCWSNPAIREFLERAVLREQSIFWKQGPHYLKVRIDCADEIGGEIGDVKTTKSIAKFRYSLDDYGYGKQGALYRRGFQFAYGVRPKFSFILVEKEPPYDCCLVDLPDEALDLGDIQNDETLANLLACKQGDQPWINPGYDQRTVLNVMEKNKISEPITTGAEREI
jgi:hypothetical protein